MAKRISKIYKTITALKFLPFVFIFLTCEDRTFENPFDINTEINPDDWAPSNLTTEILSDSQVKLIWQQSESKVEGFKVERKISANADFVEVGISDTTHFTDTGLFRGNEYIYQICAYSKENKSSYIMSDTLLTIFPAPYNVNIDSIAVLHIDLSWEDSTAFETGFKIERKKITESLFTVLDSTNANTYTDTSITLNNQYVYQVAAYTDFNTSNYTEPCSVKYWQDCSGEWSGDAEDLGCGCSEAAPDTNNCCTDGFGPNNQAPDCAGTCGGGAVKDSCGICDSDTSNDCDMDCAGIWGGELENDSCGVCGGNNTALTGSCDCFGTPNGEAFTDGCNNCVGGLTGKAACAEDCQGVLGGDALYDNCNACDNNSANDCQQDCYGDWGGSAEIDNCGVCNGNNTPGTGNCDCSGVPGGSAATDNCGVCDSDANNDCTQDCAGTWGGDAVEDCEGNCSMSGGATNNAYLGYNDNLIYNSDGFCQGCTYEGTLGYDCQKLCNGPDQIACTGYCGSPSDNGWMVNDCSYDSDNPDTHYGGSAQACGGVAAIDCNDECTGGGTGLVFAVEDCARVCGGTATDSDEDGICDNLQGTISDIDGNTYKTIKIGEQVWMAENLKVTQYRDGNEIPNINNSYDWINQSTGAYSNWGGEENVEIYGRLYNWFAGVSNNKIAPEGWHIPSDDEWQILVDYLGGSDYAGGKMKTTGTIEDGNGLWLWPNSGTTNESGFSALPGGYRHDLGNYGHMGGGGYFWSSTADSLINNAWYYMLSNNGPFVSRESGAKIDGYSIRCIIGEVDCAGIVDGTAILDCAETCGGSAANDNCGTCDTNVSNDCSQDCAGTWGGSAVLSGCDNLCSSTKVNDCAGTCGGSVVIDCAGVCGGTASDGDSDGICDWNDADSYGTVQIGSQLWMAENLKVTHYNNGDEITHIPNNGDWGSWDGQYGIYDNDPSNADIYGNLYNFAVVDDDRGVCPYGWHVPSDEEYKILEMYLGMNESEANDREWRGTDEGSKLAGNSDLWNDGNLENNSEFGTSGFNALPAGIRHYANDTDTDMGGAGYFWSSSVDATITAWNRVLTYGSSGVGRNYYDIYNGFSIRCLAD